MKISGRVSPPQSAAVVFIVLQTSNRTNVRWRPAPARWLAVWRPMQFSNFHCLVSLVCDLPYIPGDTCIVRYIPGYTRVWYPRYVPSHTYQVTRVPRLHTYLVSLVCVWCVISRVYTCRVSGVWDSKLHVHEERYGVVLYPRVPTCHVWYAGEATCEMLLTTAAGDQLGKYSKHAAGARS